MTHKLLSLALAVAVAVLAVLLWMAKSKTPRVDETFIRTQIERVAKAVTAEENLDFVYTYEATWVGSTKKAMIQATARVFAGFDVQKRLKITLDTRGRRLAIEFGEPEIIGVDFLKQHYYNETPGFWNAFGEKDRDAIAEGMREKALEAAKSGKLRTVAKESMKDFLELLMRGYGYETIVSFAEAAAPKG
jgi:hypothetical protein